MKGFDYSRTPVNREAAAVTSQSGCASDDTLTNEQKRENLVIKVRAIDVELANLSHLSKKHGKRKKVAVLKAALCLEINALRPKVKAPSIEQHIIDVMRDVLQPIQFKRIMTLAAKRSKLTENHLIADTD